MILIAPALTTLLLVLVGIVFATPVLIQGFKRRGKGVKYEHNFLIQRAPQLASGLNVLLVISAFGAVFTSPPGTGVNGLLSLSTTLPEVFTALISWLGVGILLSGMVFMIGGWYSLGECFSTDAEVLDGQTVRKDGLLKFVMHPAYSGIIQCLLGSSLAAASPAAAVFTILVVAPLWLNRAKYEEQLLIATFGESYKTYAQELKWRRLVPPVFPIGV